MDNQEKEKEKQDNATKYFRESAARKEAEQEWLKSKRAKDRIGSNYRVGMSVPLRILIGVGAWFGISLIFTLLLGGLRGTDMVFILYSLNILNFIFWVWFLFTGKLLIISSSRSSSSAKEVEVLNEELEELKAQDEIEKLKEEIAELKKKSNKD